MDVRIPLAGVMELVDVPDSKSGGVHAPCRFDPDHRHIKIGMSLWHSYFNALIEGISKNRQNEVLYGSSASEPSAKPFCLNRKGSISKKRSHVDGERSKNPDPSIF